MGIPLKIENARDVNDLDAMFLAVNEVSVLLVADDAEFTARRPESPGWGSSTDCPPSHA